GVSHSNGDTTNTPSLVIGDDCVNQEDYSCCQMKRIRYLGGLWVMLVFRSVDGKDKFKVNVGTNSWFSQLIETSSDFVIDGRVAWVEVEGIQLKVWTDNTFKRIASKWGTLLSIDNSEEDCYHNKRMCIFTADMGNTFWVRAKEVSGWSPEFEEQLDEDSEPKDDIFGGVDKPNTDNSKEEFEDENVVSDTVFDDGSVKPSVVKNSSGNQGNKSEDPFDLYPLLNKNKGEKNKDSNCSESLKFPPGFTPIVEKEVGCNMDKPELNCDNLNGGASNQGDHVNVDKGNASEEVIYKHLEMVNSINELEKQQAMEMAQKAKIKWAIEDKGNASEEVIYKRLEMVNSINELEKQQAMETAQKAKIKWTIEGDENSKYYHRILNNKGGVLESRKWIKNLDLVKKEFLNHFKNSFGRPNKTRPVLVTEFPCQLNSMQHMDMEADVTIEDIKNAVWDCGTDKSPGPNGFSFDFYRRFWSVIQKDVVAAVKCFFNYGSIPKGCNLSFIALILKIPNANMVKDFRSISLIGSLYKIIAKILANRLVPVLGDVIN
nr:RNA-directed DNA polymerase, eukaryota [Tanacetum cinerariifolium]